MQPPVTDDLKLFGCVRELSQGVARRGRQVYVELSRVHKGEPESERSDAMRSSFRSVLPGPHGWLVLALAIFALSKPGDIQAQQKPKQGEEAPAQTTPPPTNPPVIEIKVRTSGKQFVPGDQVGAMADITNKSNMPVYLRDGDVQFILALETQKNLCSCDSWFPNVTREMSKDEKKTEDPPMNEVLCIRPGDTSTVFAVCSEFSDVGDRDQNRHRKWYREFRFISFIPGTYPITVDAKYWDQKHGEEKNFSGDEYYTAVASADAEYAAPRWIILLGAIVGGFLFTSLSLIRAEEGALRGDSAGLLNIAKTLGKAKTTFLAAWCERSVRTAGPCP